MKLRDLMRRRKQSQRGERFYTQRDMAEIKHVEAIINSQVKRGEIVRKPFRYIYVCGCGCEGCFIHGSTNRDLS